MGNWNPKPPTAQPSCGLVVACQIPILPHQVSRFCSPVSIATSPPKWVDLWPGGACEALLPAVPAIPGWVGVIATGHFTGEGAGKPWKPLDLGRWKSDSWEICKILLSDFHIWNALIFARKAVVSPNPQILSIPQGVKMLLTACENETHIDLIVNALKASFFFFLEGQAHHWTKWADHWGWWFLLWSTYFNQVIFSGKPGKHPTLSSRDLWPQVCLTQMLPFGFWSPNADCLWFISLWCPLLWTIPFGASQVPRVVEDRSPPGGPVLKTSQALIPFACSDEFRPQLGMDGALGGTDFRMELAMEGWTSDMGMPENRVYPQL